MMQFPPKVALIILCSLSFAIGQTSQNNSVATLQRFPLVAPSGAPLRLYLTKRLTKRLGEPVEAKLLEPLFAFDRPIAPAGSIVLGEVKSLGAVPKMQRANALLGGDFTPLHMAQVEFTTLVLPDGRRLAIHTLESPGLLTIVNLHPRNKPGTVAGSGGGVLGAGKRQAHAQIESAKDRIHDIGDMVRGPDKKELLEDFFIKKLPYHPQWLRKGTRFDAVLSEPLPFGTAELQTDSLSLLGSQPPADSVAHLRLITPVNSGTAKQGQEVRAILSQPMFSSDHKLILPEGTRLGGSVAVAHKARWLHRGGQLRFSFQSVELPEGLVRPQTAVEEPVLKTQATLQSAEAHGKGAIKVDDEGGIKATEPKTRFIAPLVAWMIATRAADNDANKLGVSEANVGGRTLGGFSGFGLLGSAAAQSSRYVGMAFGFYGLAWSVYSNILSRGEEVEFVDNAAMDIRFGARARLAPKVAPSP